MHKEVHESPQDRTITGVLRSVALLSGLLLAVGYLAGVALGLIGPANRLTTPEIIIGVTVLAAVAFLSQQSYVVRDLAVGPAGVSAHFDRIEKRQHELETEIEALQVAVTGLVTKHELALLEKLAGEGRGVVRFSQIMVQQLDHLDAMQYVVPLDLRGLNAIGDDHGSGLDDFDLKDYVSVTQEGRQYLSLRARLAAKAAAAQIKEI